MTAGMTAIRVYLESLKQEFERINTTNRGPIDGTNTIALEEIKKKMLECEKDLSTLELYHNTKIL